MYKVEALGNGKEYPHLVNLTEIINEQEHKSKRKIWGLVSTSLKQYNGMFKQIDKLDNNRAKKYLYKILKNDFIKRIDTFKIPEICKEHTKNHITALYRKKNIEL